MERNVSVLVSEKIHLPSALHEVLFITKPIFATMRSVPPVAGTTPRSCPPTPLGLVLNAINLPSGEKLGYSLWIVVTRCAGPAAAPVFGSIGIDQIHSPWPSSPRWP